MISRARDWSLRSSVEMMSASLLLFVALPGWAWVGSGAGGWVGGTLLGYAVIAYASVRILGVAASERKHPSMLMFWLFVYVFYGVCGLAQASSATYPWGGAYSDESVFRTFLVVLIGMVAFDIGSRFGLKQNERTRTSGGGWRIKPRRLIVLTPIVLALTAISVLKMGGLYALFQSRTELELSLQSSLSSPEAAFFRHMANTPIYVLFLLTALHWKSMQGAPKSRAWLALVLFLGGITLLVNNPISTPRFQLGSVAIGSFFAFGWSRSRALAFSALMATAMLIVFPMADVYRVDSDVDLMSVVADSPAAVREITTNGDYDAFQQSANAIEVTDVKGPRLGAQIGGALLFWVPRSMWSEKPVPTGEYVAEAVGYSYLNLSAPLWAELYVDGAYMLVALGLFGFGVLLGKLDKACDSARNVRGVVTFVSALSLLVSGYQFFLLRGSLMPAIAYFCPGLLVLLIAAFPAVRVRAR